MRGALWRMSGNRGKMALIATVRRVGRVMSGLLRTKQSGLDCRCSAGSIPTRLGASNIASSCLSQSIHTSHASARTVTIRCMWPNGSDLSFIAALSMLWGIVYRAICFWHPSVWLDKSALITAATVRLIFLRLLWFSLHCLICHSSYSGGW